MQVYCPCIRPADLTLSDDTLAYLFIHEMTDSSDQTQQGPKLVLLKSQKQSKNWLWLGHKTEMPSILPHFF